MKKLIFAGLILTLLVLAVPAVAHTESDPFVTDLFAGQTMKVGEVQVWNDADTLYVKYVIDDPDWCITETHLQVATSLEDIPQKNGNPIPGQFEENDEHDCVSAVTYTYDLGDDNGWDCCDDLYIAAHAVVIKPGTITIVSSENTDVIEVNGVTVSNSNTAELAYEPFNYPTCSAYTQGDTSKSVWDTGIGTAAFNIFSADPKADWIWNTANPEHPITGDWAVFQETFSVPGTPTGGTLYITCDNGYSAAFNGDFLDSAQLGTGFSGTLKETVDSIPQVGDWGVASQGWQSVESYPLTGLSSGVNTLTITAANEYMWNDGGYSGPDRYYSSWDPSGGSIVNDPFPGTGIGGTSYGDNICRNPAGLIFKATVDYEQDETAWGAGLDFPGKNWATYFEYQVQCPPEKVAAVRFRSFGNTGGNEIYIGKEDLGVGANRDEYPYVWVKPGNYLIVYEYDPVVTSGEFRFQLVDLSFTTPTVTQWYDYPGTVPEMDSCEIIVADRDFDTSPLSQVDFKDVKVQIPKGGTETSLGSFYGDDTFAAYPFFFGSDLNDGFRFSGKISISGPFSNSQEKSKVEILCGQNFACPPANNG